MLIRIPGASPRTQQGMFLIEALLGIAAPDAQTRAGVVAQGVEAFLAAGLPVANPA